MDQHPAQLVALHEDVQLENFNMGGDLCTIGRSPACQVVVKRKTVSRLHAKIERDQTGRYFLTDTDSANGIFLNGERRRLLKPHLLRDGDEIGLGSVETLLRFEDIDSTATVVNTRLYYDPQRMNFYLDKEPVELTPGQSRLLQHLMMHADEICTRESCAEALWGREYDPVLDDLPLNRTISNIRRQFRQIAPETEFIITHRGIGYMLVSNP